MNFPFLSNFVQDVEIFYRRRGGDDVVEPHERWLSTVAATPDVIAMTFVPISSLISGIPGNGYLSHAVNLYMRCMCLFSFFICAACHVLTQ